MATREENLKKINDELEKLSDEQLDNVAGGFVFLPALFAPFAALVPTGDDKNDKKGTENPKDGAENDISKYVDPSIDWWHRL